MAANAYLAGLPIVAVGLQCLNLGKPILTDSDQQHNKTLTHLREANRLKLKVPIFTLSN